MARPEPTGRMRNRWIVGGLLLGLAGVVPEQVRHRAPAGERGAAQAQDDRAGARQARDAAGHAYDSADRRGAFAADLERRGIATETIATRMRADVSNGRPATDAVTAPSKLGAAHDHHGPRLDPRHHGRPGYVARKLVSGEHWQFVAVPQVGAEVWVDDLPLRESGKALPVERVEYLRQLPGNEKAADVHVYLRARALSSTVDGLLAAAKSRGWSLSPPTP
jgi:hypothetical protein